MRDADGCRGELERIKRETEALWRDRPFRRGIGGYQVQPGTRWNPGLGPREIDAYERALGIPFPARLRCMLSVMNGTDLPQINFYGGYQAPHERMEFCAYPRDLAEVRERIGWVEEERAEITDALADQGFELRADDGLVPIYAHRYLLCRPGEEDGPVLSIHGADAIIYGDNLLNYLRIEFLPHTLLEQPRSDLPSTGEAS